VSQHGLLAVDVADATFDEVVHRVWRSSLGAGMHAYLDPRSLKALVATIEQDRVEPLDLECYFNDARLHRPLRPGPPPTGAELRAALARTEFRWDFQHDRPNGRLYMFVDEELTGAVDAMAFQICADTHYWPPDALEGLIRDIEQILVDAIVDPEAAVSQRTASSAR
jgi:hypothetical protein